MFDQMTKSRGSICSLLFPLPDAHDNICKDNLSNHECNNFTFEVVILEMFSIV